MCAPYSYIPRDTIFKYLVLAPRCFSLVAIEYGEAFMTVIDPTTLRSLHQKIREKSPFPSSENERLIKHYFIKLPRGIPYLAQKYGFAKKKVLDIGSTFGTHLFFWGPGSEGVEVQNNAATFTDALGFPAHRINVEDDLGTLPANTFNAIHTNNLFEHLVAPHMFLMRCHRLLTDDGILAIGHPTVPPTIVRWLWKAIGIDGWLAVEHINFFTPATVKLTLERAGFEVIEQYSPWLLRFPKPLGRLILPYSISCYSICRKRSDFRYPSKRMAIFDPNVYSEELAEFHNES